jgi:hypothetical protein
MADGINQTGLTAEREETDHHLHRIAQAAGSGATQIYLIKNT